MDSDDDDRPGGLAVLVEHCLVDLALLEPEAAEDLCELLIPPAAGLLEAIQGLAKMQDTPGGVLVISRGVTHVEYLVVHQLAVEVRTLYVHLMQLQSKVVGHGNDCVQRRKSGNRSIGVKIIDSFDLTEALGHQAHLVAHNLTRHVLLSLKDPFRANNIGSRWCVLKCPGASDVQCGKLLVDGLLSEWPIGLALRLSQVMWF